MTSGGIDYDASAGAYRVPFDPSTSGAIAGVVATAVAEIEGVDYTALPVIHDVVDPEAVDRLLAAAADGSARADVTVEFPYAGYRVTARPDEVVLRPSEPLVVPTDRG